MRPQNSRLRKKMLLTTAFKVFGFIIKKSNGGIINKISHNMSHSDKDLVTQTDS
jgi:hypothetical protein